MYRNETVGEVFKFRKLASILDHICFDLLDSISGLTQSRFIGVRKIAIAFVLAAGECGEVVLLG